MLRGKFLSLGSHTDRGRAVTADLHISPQSLAAADLFAGLPISLLKIAAAAARPHRVPGGTRIFNQSDQSVRARAVIRGRARISQIGSDGAQAVLRLIGPGNIVETVALFTDGCHPADATAVADTLEASWSEPELQDLMTRYPQIAINAIRIIGQRPQGI